MRTGGGGENGFHIFLVRITPNYSELVRVNQMTLQHGGAAEHPGMRPRAPLLAFWRGQKWFSQFFSSDYLGTSLPGRPAAVS